MITIPNCPDCAAATRQTKAGFNQTKAGFNRCGTQRLHCQHCRRYHTLQQHCRRYHTLQPKNKGYSPQMRRAALRMYLNGINFRRTARLIGVAPQTVVNWVKDACDALGARTPAMLLGQGRLRCSAYPPDARPSPNSREGRVVHIPDAEKNVEKNLAYVCTAVDRDTRCILAWTVSRMRDLETLRPLVDQMVD